MFLWTKRHKNEYWIRRYAGTVLSNTAVFSLTGALLGFGGNQSEKIGPCDVPVFRNVALACVGAGGLMSLLFHLTVKVKEDNESDTSPLITDEDDTNDINHDVTDEGQGSDEPDTDHNPFPEVQLTPQPSVVVNQRAVEPMSIMNWVSEPQFYQVAVIYMSTRLFVNISQAYIPLYIQHTLSLKPVSIAGIPLIMFLSGFVVSLINKPITRLIGRKWSMALGCTIGLAGSVWVEFGTADSESFTTYQVGKNTML